MRYLRELATLCVLAGCGSTTGDQRESSGRALGPYDLIAAHAATENPRDFTDAELVERSELIVRGSLVAAETGRSIRERLGESPFTTLALLVRVDRVLLGEEKSSIWLELLAGDADAAIRENPDERDLQMSGGVVLFLDSPMSHWSADAQFGNSPVVVDDANLYSLVAYQGYFESRGGELRKLDQRNFSGASNLDQLSDEISRLVARLKREK